MENLLAVPIAESEVRLTLRGGAFLAAKSNTPVEESEDALAADGEAGRFAVSDGAGTTSFSREWANLLAEQMVAFPLAVPEPDAETLNEWLGAVQQAWHDAVPWDSLSFFRKRKALEGAYATALTLTMDAPSSLDDGRWGWKGERVGVRIAGVGDSCAFRIRDGRLVGSWFQESSNEFGLAITAVSSLSQENEPAAKGWREVETEGEAGDLWLLTTDALSAFLLRQWEADGEEWEELLAWLDALLSPDESESERAFETFLAEKRAANLLREDDVALILLALDAVSETVEG